MLCPHMHSTHLSFSHTHLSSNLVSLYRCHQPWWCQGGLKSAWVIAKVIDRLTRPYAPLSTENYLSFIRWLKPFGSPKSFTCCLLSWCGCVHEQLYIHGCEQGVSVGFWRPLHSSFWRFCSRPVSLRIDNALLRVGRKSEAAAEEAKRQTLLL